MIQSQKTFFNNSKMKKILVTGGLGYIGSHASVLLLNAGYELVVVDNLSNSSLLTIDSIKEITKKTLFLLRQTSVIKEKFLVFLRIIILSLLFILLV